MTAAPSIAPDAFKVADPELLAALIAEADAGITQPSWQAVADALGRDRANVHRSAKRIASTGLIGLDPLAITGTARALLLAWSGEAPAPAGSAAPAGGETAIPHDRIHASPLNPRKTFDEAELDELAASIAEKGLLQNIVLRPHPETEGAFEIAAGERRWRAVGRLIERGEAPADYPMRALVQDLSDNDLLLVALAENRDRRDPPPMEEAQGIAAFRAMRVRQILEEIYDGDPIAKGFTEDQIKSERRLAEGTAMKELAGALGKTDRWVQLRYNLATDLAPELQTALNQGEISLAQARAVRKASHDRQRNALPHLAGKDHYWITYDQVVHQMRNDGLAASDAWFDPADYDGETMEDPETGEAIYLDKALITTLQTAAMKRRVKALKKDGAAFAEILPYRDSSRFARADENTALPVGYVLVLEYDGRVHMERVVRQQDLNASGKQAIKVQRTDSDDDAAEIVPPFGPRHWTQAARINTARFQEGLASAAPQLAMAVAICGLLPSTFGQTGGVPGDWIKGHWRNGADDDIAPPAALAERVGALGPGSGLLIKSRHVAVENPSRALALLRRQPLAVLAEILAAVVAAQCGPWPGVRVGPGCTDIVKALASEMVSEDNTLPAFEMTADYLQAFTVSQLRRIAFACIGVKVGGMPTKKADAVSWILDHPDRDTNWCPPELHFAAEATVEERVNAMLAGEGGKA